MISGPQEAVLHELKSGKSVVCTACAGGGKTTLIVEACARTPHASIVLAYNRQLAQDTRDALAESAPRGQCFTFHGLASRLFRSTPDDDALAGVVDDLEAGILVTPTELQLTPHICVDEAQDLTCLHVRFVRLVFPNPAQFLIVGDDRQMLYDYHTQNPASIEFMRSPASWCNSSGEWVRCQLAESFRISSHMAAVANAARVCEEEEADGASDMSTCERMPRVRMPGAQTPDVCMPDERMPDERMPDEQIPDAPEGHGEDSENGDRRVTSDRPHGSTAREHIGDRDIIGRGASSDPVDVVFANNYEWYSVVAAVLRDHPHAEVVILTRRRRNNAPLTVLLNQLSNRHGVQTPLHVHGADAVDKRVAVGKLRVLTWHASKGMQARVVIALGVARLSDRNALHVALTRATHRLVVVQNVDDPHVALVGDRLRRLIDAGHVRVSRLQDSCSPRAPVRGDPVKAPALVNVDEWAGDGVWREIAARAHFDEVCDTAHDVGDVGGLIDADAPATRREHEHENARETEHDQERAQTVRVDDRWEDVSDTLCDATLVAVEAVVSGTCVLTERQAHRASHQDAARYVASGGQARIVPPLPGPPLALDLSTVYHEACDRVRCSQRGSFPRVNDCLVVAAGMRSWGGYNHQMRQMLPLSWTRSFHLRGDAERLASFVKATVGIAPTFHRRFHATTADGGVLYGSAFAVGGGEAVRVVSAPCIARVDRARAALLLCLSPGSEVSRVSIYNLRTHAYTRVRVDAQDRAALLASAIASDRVSTADGVPVA